MRVLQPSLHAIMNVYSKTHGTLSMDVCSNTHLDSLGIMWFWLWMSLLNCNPFMLCHMPSIKEGTYNGVVVGMLLGFRGRAMCVWVYVHNSFETRLSTFITFPHGKCCPLDQVMITCQKARNWIWKYGDDLFKFAGKVGVVGLRFKPQEANT